MALTPRQKEVLDFILKFSEQHGYSPSFEEIAGVLSVSERTVQRHWRTARAWLFARLSE